MQRICRRFVRGFIVFFFELLAAGLLAAVVGFTLGRYL